MTDLRAAVWADPGRRSGAVCIYGHRLDVKMVGGLVFEDGVDAACEMWVLTRAEVVGGCWWLAVHGSREWRRRWGAWATEHQSLLWRGGWDEAPDPPLRAEETA